MQNRGKRVVWRGKEWGGGGGGAELGTLKNSLRDNDKVETKSSFSDAKNIYNAIINNFTLSRQCCRVPSSGGEG